MTPSTSFPRRWIFSLLAPLAALLLWVPWTSPALAVAAGNFPDTPPVERVLDGASVLSRSAIGDVSRQLESFQDARVDAHLITVNQLDYGLSLTELGQQLLQRWPLAAGQAGQILFLIDSQTNSAAVVASEELAGQISPELLRSTGRTTMAAPIRDGARFRQASLDGIQRISTVLQGGEDPGAPETLPVNTIASNIPSREETAASNAFTWIVVLLVVGTIVPMLTWWVFSR